MKPEKKPHPVHPHGPDRAQVAKDLRAVRHAYAEWLRTGVAPAQKMTPAELERRVKLLGKAIRVIEAA